MHWHGASILVFLEGRVFSKDAGTQRLEEPQAVNFSIWDYIRQRTRNAVLSGIQDAMDFVEQGDTNGEQHAKAEELASKLNPPKGLPGVTATNDLTDASPQEVTQEPAGATVNGSADSKADPAPPAAQQAAGTPKQTASPTKPPTPRPKQDSFDDELERRLHDAAVPPTHSSPPRPEDGRVLKDADGKPLRKRGRPRKDAGL